MRCALALGTVLALFASGSAHADCQRSGASYAIDAAKLGLGPRHHPLGRPLPDTASFNQPGRCLDDVWFFDQNGNGAPDAGELRLFGSQRVVDCGSCHGESVDAKSPQSASVILRQDASSLCLVCHRL